MVSRNQVIPYVVHSLSKWKDANSPVVLRFVGRMSIPFLTDSQSLVRTSGHTLYKKGFSPSFHCYARTDCGSALNHRMSRLPFVSCNRSQPHEI